MSLTSRTFQNLWFRSDPLHCVQRLLLLPELSNSQLLADFLSPFSLESQFLDKMLPDVNLGGFYSGRVRFWWEFPS